MRCRSAAAPSGVRAFQKYCSEFSPTTGTPLPARTFATSWSMPAQPPSPETITASRSPAGCFAGLDLAHVRLDVLRRAHLVDESLEGHPGLLESGGRLEADALALRSGAPGQPMAGAERLAQRQVGAEAHADRALEGVRRRLDQQ